MSTIRIDKPRLDKPTNEQNMAILDRWIADTADKMNTFIAQTERKLGEKGESNG